MKLTKLSTLAIAAVVAIPLGVTAGNALASAQTTRVHQTGAQSTPAAQKNGVEKKDVEKNDTEKPDAESAKEPKETVDRDNVQEGPGNTQDGDKETSDGPG